MKLMNHILVALIVAIMLMHIAIPHNHYTKSDDKHSIEHSEPSDIVELLGLAFHNSSEKDLSESNKAFYHIFDLSAQEVTAYPFVIYEVTDIEQTALLVDYPPVFIEYYKYYYSNKLPLRAPPEEII